MIGKPQKVRGIIAFSQLSEVHRRKNGLRNILSLFIANNRYQNLVKIDKCLGLNLDMRLNDSLQDTDAMERVCVSRRCGGDDERPLVVGTRSSCGGALRQGREQLHEQGLFFELGVVATSWPIQMGMLSFFSFCLHVNLSERKCSAG